MQAGPVGGSPSQYGIKKQYGGAETTPSEHVEEQSVAEAPKEEVTLAARFKTTTDALQTEDAGNGQLRSKMTIALAPQSSQAELEKLGVIFPEIEEVRSNQGLRPDGRLELVPVDGTGNPETAHILQTLEVPKSAFVKDADGNAPIDSMTAKLLREGDSVIPKGWFGVAEGTVIAPRGYDVKMGTSEAGAKTEAKRLRLNGLSDGLGNFAQSSLAGVITLPYVSSVAPFVAMASAGASLNKHYGELKDSQDLLGYVESREKYSKTDMITLEVGVNTQGGENPSVPVSAEAEKKRMELKIRTAKAKLASTALGGAAGAASVLSFAAAGGAFGSGATAVALTGAIAATPYLAGAAMIISSGGMVLNSLSELKSLSKEKAELQAALDGGQTHVLKTIERVDPQARRHVAIGEQQVPIAERLDVITKEQRKHRLLATALSGGMGSIAMTVAVGASALSMAPLAIAPAGILAGAQSVTKLRELSKEKKELNELHKTGATMAPRQIERSDGSWNEEKIPISTLLKDIEKKQKTHKAILTAVGSAGLMFGATLGMGLSFAAASPLLLIPAIIGAALFPDKVKAFADKVVGFVSGKFGEAGKSRKELLKQAQAKTQETKEAINESTRELAKTNPELFYVPSKAELKAAKANNQAPPIGYFTYLEQLMDTYAGAGSRVGRYQAMQEIESLLAQAPPEAQGSVSGVRAKLKDLHMDTEAGWVARDVMLEMKKDVTDKVVGDTLVADRLKDLGYGADNLREQYEESLYIDNDVEKLNALLEKSRAGDRDASLQLARKEVFGAGRLFYQSQEELGTDLHAKLLDAMARPQDGANLELVIKEVNHKLGRPMAPSTGSDKTEQWWLGESTQNSEAGLQEPLRLPDLMPLRQAAVTLSKPLDIGQAGAPTEAQASALEGPQGRMASAFRQLHAADSDAAAQLGKAFAILNDPQSFEGLSPQEAQQKKLEAGLELTQAKGKLEDKAPEILALWEKARVDVEEEYFQRSVDHQFAGQVLARPEVAEASQRLGVNPEDTKALYMGLLRSHVTGDARALQGQMVDASGKEIDPAKSELLQVLDRTMTAVATELVQGGNDTVVPQAQLGNPSADPQVAAFLQANPVIENVLESDQLNALAAELQVSPEDARQAYLTLVQANLNPLLTAEFDGLYSGGDIKTVQAFQIGSRVGDLVKAATRPSAEAVAQQLEGFMAGPVAATVLGHPDIKTAAEQLKVDASVLLRTLVAGDLSADNSAVVTRQAQAQKGDTVAQAELQMIQLLAQATLQIQSQLQSQQAPVQQAA
jgi:hypothetical protein